MRTTPALAVLLSSLTGLLPACTSSSTDDGQHIDLISTPYTLQPGDEKYFCYSLRLPPDRDLALTKFTPTYGPGTHHILFSQTISPEPDGFSECNTLIRSTWVPLYAGGKDSGALELPANTGMKTFEKGQQLLMQLHLQNATDQPITATTQMRVDFVDRTPEIQTASIFGMDNRKLDIPPHTASVDSMMSCMIDRDLDVFAVLGHMHKHGVHLDVSRSSGGEMLYQEAWNFEQQPVTEASFHVSKGENLQLRCNHKNDGDKPVIYGESSDTEMCAFVMYYAPADSLDGCINQ